MIIVNREEFLLLPPGTLYSRYQPCTSSGLEIKGNSIGVGEDWSGDWFFQNIIGEIGMDCTATIDPYEIMENGTDIRLDLNIQERDGRFEADDQFLIYSPEDTKEIITTLGGLK